jgi:hypothetical protein
MILDSSGLRHVPYHPVANITLIASRLPCDEDRVERAFSRLGFIFGDHRRSIQDELVAALLIIKLHRAPNCPASSSVLERVCTPLRPDSVNHPADDADGSRSPPGIAGDGSQSASQPEPRLSHWRAGAIELTIGAQPPDGGRPS